MDKFTELYNYLYKEALTDLSKEEFKNKYATGTDKNKTLYSYLKSKNLTDLDSEKFNLEYFPSVKKKDTSEPTSVEEPMVSDTETGSLEPSKKMVGERYGTFSDTGEKNTWLEEMVGKYTVTDFFGDMWRAGKQGLAQGATVDDSIKLLAQGSKMSEESLDEFIRVSKEVQSFGMSDEMKAFNKIYEKEGGGIVGFMKGVVKNPSVLNQLLISSLAAMVNPTVAAGAATGGVLGAGTGAALGSVGGPLAAVTALGGGLSGLAAGASGTLEAGLSVAEFLQDELNKKGLEFDNEGIKTVLEDNEALQRIRNKSAARGLVIGAIDGITAGLASKVGTTVGKAARAAGRTKAAGRAALTATGIEAAGGGVGETAARLATGQELDVAEIGFETVTGTVGAPLSAAKAVAGIDLKRATKEFVKPSKYKVNDSEVSREDVEQFVDTMSDEEIAKTKFEVENNDALKKEIEDRKKKALDTARVLDEVPDNYSSDDKSKLVDLEILREKLSSRTTKTAKDQLKLIDGQIEEINNKYAVQKPSTEKVDVQKPTPDSGEVGKGDTKQVKPTKEVEAKKEPTPTKEKVQDEEVITVKDEEVVSLKPVKKHKTAFEKGELSRADKIGILTYASNKKRKGKKLTPFEQRVVDSDTESYVDVGIRLEDRDKAALEQEIDDRGKASLEKKKEVKPVEYDIVEGGIPDGYTVEGDIKNIREEDGKTVGTVEISSGNIILDEDVALVPKEEAPKKEVKTEEESQEELDRESRISILKSALGNEPKLKGYKITEEDKKLADNYQKALKRLESEAGPYDEGSRGARMMETKGMNAIFKKAKKLGFEPDRFFFYIQDSEVGSVPSDLLVEKKEAPKKEAPKKEAPKKEAPKKEAPKKEAPKKEAPKKEAPKKEVSEEIETKAKTTGGRRGDKVIKITSKKYATIDETKKLISELDKEIAGLQKEINKYELALQNANNDASLELSTQDLKETKRLINERLKEFKKEYAASELKKQGIENPTESQISSFLQGIATKKTQITKRRNKRIDYKQQIENQEKKPARLKELEDTSQERETPKEQADPTPKIEEKKIYEKAEDEVRRLERERRIEKKQYFDSIKGTKMAPQGVEIALEEIELKYDKLISEANKKASDAVNELKKAEDAALKKKRPKKDKGQKGPKLKGVVNRELLQKQVDRAKRALLNIAPTVNIVIVDDPKTYREIALDNSNGFYDPTDGNIYINASRAIKSTVGHEVFHAILLRNGISDMKARDITKRMVDTLKKSGSLPQGLINQMEAFGNQYVSSEKDAIAELKLRGINNPTKNQINKTLGEMRLIDPVFEEQMAELIGALAGSYKQLSRPQKSIVKRFLDRLAKLFGLKKFTDTEVVDLINTISRSVVFGDVIAAEDVAILSAKETDKISEVTSKRKQKTKSDILRTLKEGQKLPTKPKQIKNKNGLITSGKVHLYHSTNGVENLNDILENGIDFEKQKAVDGLFFSKLGGPYRQDDSFVVIETDVENIPFNQRIEGQEVALGQLSDYKIVYSSKMSPRELKSLSSLEMILNRKKLGGVEVYEKSLQNYKKRNKNSELVKYLEDAPQSKRKQKPNYKLAKINTPNTTINVVEGAGPDSFEIATKDYKATEGVEGSTIIGFVKDRDFPGEKKKETRGEVFILEVNDKGKGTGTSLMLDALRLMKENGTKTVKFTVPSKEGKPFNESLVRKGYINLLKVSDRTGTSEYEITDKILEDVTPRKQISLEESNLTPEQYDLVRTDEFKNWFGDWENDPENASKIVDENGEPKVVYHGSLEKFDSFKKGSKGYLGSGIYFSDDKDFAQKYADKQGKGRGFLYETFLNIKDPINIEGGEGTDVLLKEVYGNDKIFNNRIKKQSNYTYLVQSRDVKKIREDYDGIQWDFAGDSEFVVYEPNQVKAADGSNVKFDPNSKSIRKQKSSYVDVSMLEDMTRDGMTAEYAERGSRVERFLQKVQDKYIKVRRIGKTIEKRTGKKLESVDDFDKAETLYTGRTKEQVSKLEERFEKIIEKFASKGLTRKDISDYLYAMHAPERNDYILEEVDGSNIAGSGMYTDINDKNRAVQELIITQEEADSIESAQEVIKRLKDEGKIKDLESIASDIREIQLETLDRQFKEGLITKETYENLGMTETKLYKHYVPLKGFKDLQSGFSDYLTGEASSTVPIKGKEILRAKGRKTVAGDVLSNIMMDSQTAVIRSNKNSVLIKLLNQLLKNPDDSIYSVYTEKEGAPIGDRKMSLQEMRDKTTRDKSSARYFKFVRVVKDGKEYFIDFKDKDMTRVINLTDGEMIGTTMNEIVDSVGKVTNIMRAAFTTMNPGFIPTNYIRDIQTGLMNALAETDMKIADKKKFIKNVSKNSVKALKTIAQEERGKTKGVDKELVKYYREFKENGAVAGYSYVQSESDISKGIDALAEGGKKNDTIKSIGKFINAVNTASENSTRLAAYIEARKSGMTAEDAAYMAKNLTVNFNRSGEYNKAINTLYMFFNASVQGTVAFTKAMTTLKKEVNDDGTISTSLNYAQKVAIGIVAFSALMQMLNQGLSDEDEDGESFFDKIPEYEKERNLIIMNPANGKDYFKVPLPYGYNFFFNIGRFGYEVSNKKKSIADVSKDLVNSSVSAFSPISFSASKDVTGSFVKTATPTVAKPFMDLALNENFFKGAIYKENFPGQNKPDSSMGKQNTPEVIKEITKFINRATGGSENVKGFIDVSPETIPYIIQQYTGGAGRFLSQAMNFPSKVAGGELKPREIPMFDRLYGRTSRYSDIDTYNERRDQVKSLEEEIKSGDIKRDMKVYRSAVAISRLSKKVDKKLNELRDKKKKVAKLDSRSRQTVLIKRIEEKEDQLYDQFNKQYLKLFERYSKDRSPALKK